VNLFLQELLLWTEAFLAFLPGRFGRFFRMLYFCSRFESSGKKISIGRFVEIDSPENISVGNNIYIVDGSVIRARDGRLKIGNNFAMNGNSRIVADCDGKITIGNSVMVGPNVIIRASNHKSENAAVDIWLQGQTGGTIIIGDDVWIAANVVILPEVRIGSHSIIAAGAVVTKDVPEYSVVAGVPARVISRRV
jgi:galactoside O-acetyltransferase